MAESRKPDDRGQDVSPWLITLSDLMTLLLTFFLMLVSMSVIDERNRLAALNSVSSSFGAWLNRPVPGAPADRTSGAEPHNKLWENMTPLKELLWDDALTGVTFQENRFVQVLSVNADTLFTPDETTLSPQGMLLLDRMVPYLMRIRYPLLVAGHAAHGRDEEKENYKVDLDAAKPASTWPLSLSRAQAVYRYLTKRGIPADRLLIEAFGQHRPRFSDMNPAGRLQNRRVDLVLDKRNAPELLHMEQENRSPYPGRHFFFKGFRFDLEAGPPGSGGR